MVAGHHRVCHDHHSVRAPVYPVGRMAVSHRRDLHLRMPLHGLVDRAVLPVARCRKLSAKFRMADLDDPRGHNSGLAIDEDEKLRADVAFRRRDLGGDGVELQLHPARSVSPADTIHASHSHGGRRPGLLSRSPELGRRNAAYDYPRVHAEAARLLPEAPVVAAWGVYELPFSFYFDRRVVPVATDRDLHRVMAQHPGSSAVLSAAALAQVEDPARLRVLPLDRLNFDSIVLVTDSLDAPRAGARP